MVGRWFRFNIILLLLAVLALVAGCQSAEKKREKQIATLRVHMESSPSLARGETISVFRAEPITMYVERSPFLSEAHVASAKIVTNMGAFSIHVEFTREGAWLLEQYTSGNPGKHVAIRSQFGYEPVTDRWLAAPLLRQPVRSGFLVFTPDADMDETAEIVRGLNNVAKKANNAITGKEK